MRTRALTFLSILLFVLPAVGQAATAPLSFLGEVSLKYPALLTLHGLQLSGNAEWVSGATQESGTAAITAGVDGSSTLQLTLATATRTETRTATGSSRSCLWVDAKSVQHTIEGPDCAAPIAWFAPLLFAQPVAALAALVTITDDGLVTRDGASFHQISYETPITTGEPNSSALLTSATRVSVLYDPATLLPASVEYVQHADNNLRVSFPVRVVYSNYQTTSGLPLPQRIDRYVNNALQLSVTLTSASLT